MAKVAVVLFNLGGPDGPDAVRPFLYNLFKDPAILGLPAILRQPLAWLIARNREKSAKLNYAMMGGGSPLLPETQAQAAALEGALAKRAQGAEVKVFIAMRYWNPFIEQVAEEVAAFLPDEVVLLPLYPQFSTTTTESSLRAWDATYAGSGRVRAVCCYPTLEGLVEAHARRIEAAWAQAGSPEPKRVLFSAHGLPEKVIERGDPYQSQVEATAEAVAERLGDDWDWQVCYQSRVGPLAWIGPSTPMAIAFAAEQKVSVVVTPIAFVSEHVETLVELDIEYAALAHELGCPAYVRAPALGIEEGFIDALAGMAMDSIRHQGICPGSRFFCSGDWPKCVRTSAGAAAWT